MSDRPIRGHGICSGRRVMKTLRPFALSLLAALPLTGCGDPGTSDEQDLTSIRSQSREIRFEGRVFVEPEATQSEILDVVHRQTKTAFGPLKAFDIGVNDRELKGVDPETFVKREVMVVDTADASKEPVRMVEVRYTYVDDAVVPKTMADESTLSLALLRPDYSRETSRVLEECTANDSHARDFSSSLWYVFEPNRPGCIDAIQREQLKVDEARALLSDPTLEVAAADVERLYLPITAALGPDQSNEKDSYPEYDRLYAGGVKPGKLVISVINGLIDHDPGGELHRDPGFGEWLDTLDEVFTENPGFEVIDVEGGADIADFTLESGKTVSLTFAEAIALHEGSGPSGLDFSEKEELEGLFADRVADKWITFELERSVSIGGAEPVAVGIQIMAFFGHADSTAPFKLAIKNSDVFLYNGHSNIGFGPLDPKNFSASDFPSSYQILFIDSCVSYNYYEADYIPLKEGGTKNLDLVTNAVESPSWRSGFALGRFINTLIDGKQSTYMQLLESAEATGSGMRVVNGELDNEYDPAATPIEVR